PTEDRHIQFFDRIQYVLAVAVRIGKRRVLVKYAPFDATPEMLDEVSIDIGIDVVDYTFGIHLDTGPQCALLGAHDPRGGDQRRGKGTPGDRNCFLHIRTSLLFFGLRPRERKRPYLQVFAIVSMYVYGSALPRLFEEPRGEVIQTPAPCQPLMGRAGRFKVDVLNARFGQLLAEVLGVGSFDRSDAQEQELHFLVKRGVIRKHASAGRLGVESRPAAAVAAESSQV